ncbi:MAG: type II toxin-antitoxin system MqsA family antitoxin [Candidatus Hatepunaea meridiana]|nr:type II toxin-antitoxin system MqsA family antitoxin [Candidatus Hatepunaea meridiana]
MRNKEFPKNAKCPLCRGRIAPGTTTFTADLDKGVIIVHDVPAQICGQCGEEWFTNEVSHQLDELASDMRAKGSEVEIISFNMANAESVKV